jgi:16S rRNA (adenine1518-N6/adenine1519-N6)-dimethyltransferase
MLYNNKEELLHILSKNRLYTEKKFGQNFLINPQIIEKILNCSEIKSEDYVVEVGPGLGIMTLELSTLCKKVDTIEIDEKLLPYLNSLFKDHQNINLIHQDVLKTIPPNTNYKVIANIPYYITSPIIRHYLSPHSESAKPISLTLLVQLEVAEKICADTGNHSVLSLLTQCLGKPSIIAKVPAHNFFPSPKVDSAILKINTHPTPLVEEFTLFTEIIKKAFSQKRKTISNSLKNFKSISKENLNKILEESGISSKERPEKLNFHQWNLLTKNISKQSNLHSPNPSLN